MQTFFTFAAVKIVMSQLEGIGRGDLGSYNAEGYTNLSKFVREHPLRNDADAWLANLMQVRSGKSYPLIINFYLRLPLRHNFLTLKVLLSLYQGLTTSCRWMR
jgi:hypothetical protein